MAVTAAGRPRPARRPNAPSPACTPAPSTRQGSTTSPASTELCAPTQVHLTGFCSGSWCQHFLAWCLIGDQVALLCDIAKSDIDVQVRARSVGVDGAGHSAWSELVSAATPGERAQPATAAVTGGPAAADSDGAAPKRRRVKKPAVERELALADPKLSASLQSDLFAACMVHLALLTGMPGRRLHSSTPRWHFDCCLPLCPQL